MSRAIECIIFVYVPRTEYLKNGLATISFACVLFNTGWERGGVQAAKKITSNQRQEAKDMECPFFVRYNYGDWLHDFYAANFHLQRYIFETIINLKPVCGAL